MAEGIGVDSQHDPRTHTHRNVEAKGFVIQETSKTSTGPARSGGRGFRRLANKKAHAVIIDKAALVC